MSRESLERWLLGRTPTVPAPFLPHLLGPDGDVFGGASQLEAMGLAGIHRALGHPGRNREGAFHLLAGDAHLTYACEALAREKDPGEALRLLLRRVGDHFR